MEDKIKRISKMVEDISDVEVHQDTDTDYSLTNDYGLDSFDLAELTVRIEDEYGVDVFEDGSVDSISEIVEKIKE
jgi:acyl carrier protein